MKRLFTLSLILLAAPVLAAGEGAIGILLPGRYMCELPGDAMGQAGKRQPDADFEVINASSYASATGSGSYLRIGDIVTLTSGTRRGERYHRLSNGFLRRIGDDGRDTALRCIRRNRNNR